MSTDLLILSYHAVSPTWPAALSVTPERLEDQLRLLLDRGYHPVRVHEAVHAPPAERTLAVTFDDAYRSVFDHALPVLSRLGVVASVFVPTDYVEPGAPMAWPGIDGWLGGPHESELRPMSWGQLRTLAGEGWEIGSHSCTHPRLTRLDDAALEHELGDSRARCGRELGDGCRSLAYPFGDEDGRVVAAARAAGYEAAVTVPENLRSDDPLRTPRIGIYHDDGAVSFRLKVSGAVRLARRTRVAGPATRTARRALALVRR